MTEAGNVNAELEAVWQERLLEDIAHYDFVPRTTYLKKPSSKWRVSSAMQKAIRRGHVEVAVRMANGLHSHDPAYVWRRLCTVVMEEVGVADLDLCGRFLWVATKRVWRATNGGEDGDRAFLYMLVEQMCRSVKDRNACDLPGWVEMDPDFADHREATKDLNLEQLAEIVADNDVPLENRALVAQAMAYWDRVDEAFSKTEGFKAYLEALRAAGIPENVIEVARIGRQKQFENMPFGIPFVWRLVTSSSTVKVREDHLTQLPFIGGYPSETFDMHNQDGKRALAYFYQSCAPVREALERLVEGNRMWALGALVFRIEGHQVDRRLVYDGSTDIDRQCRRAHLYNNHIPIEAQAELLALVAQNLQRLQEARLRIVAPTV